MPNKYPEKKSPRQIFKSTKKKKNLISINYIRVFSSQRLSNSKTQRRRRRVRTIRTSAFNVPPPLTSAGDNKVFQFSSLLWLRATLSLSLSLRLYLLTIYIGFSAFVFLCKCIKLLIGSCLFSFPKSFCFCFWLFSI